MYNWLFTEEDREEIRSDFSAFEKSYPHYEEDVKYGLLKRLYDLLENKESQAKSMTRSPFDEFHYYRFKEDREYLQRVIQFVKKEARSFREGRFSEVSLDTLGHVYEKIKGSLNCQSSLVNDFGLCYLKTSEPFQPFISEFQGYSDILDYALLNPLEDGSYQMSYEDYYKLVRAYQIYQNELSISRIQQRNLESFEVGQMRQNPFDVLYHKMSLEKRDGESGAYLKHLDLARSYGEEALALVIENCEKELHSSLPKKEYVPLMRTFRLSMDALERGKKNE